MKGYNFCKEYNVFNDYVMNLYKIKSTTRNKVEKAVSKSLLNNLLGRFGLNIYKSTTEIVDRERLNYLISTRNFTSYYKITNNDFLITYNPQPSLNICDKFGYDYTKVLKESGNLLGGINTKDGVGEFKDVSIVI
ncbi:DNA polymerase, partial [Streptomyces ziwulingensis]|uniref:DNA polymerase n=1 Tax=Streptomyces ziwulingensis TaxID=1045501 RepID=UPI0031EC0244